MPGVIPPNPYAGGRPPAEPTITHSQHGPVLGGPCWGGGSSFVNINKKYGPPLGKKASYAAASSPTVATQSEAFQLHRSSAILNVLEKKP